MYANKKKNNFSKVVVVVVCLAMLLGGIIGGTIAYLMTDTDPVVNTFVAGDIGELELKETYNTDTNNDNVNDAWTAIVTPGVDLSKDPKVTFSGNNVDAYVFLKVDVKGWEVDATNHMNYGCVKVNGTNLVTWTIGDGWEYLTIDSGSYIYVAEVPEGGSLTAEVIKGSVITVDEDITKEDLANFAADSSLTFSAYAIQQAKDESITFTKTEAWGLANAQ